GGAGGLHNRLRERRMRMHRFDDLVRGRLQFARRDRLGNQLGRIARDDMAAQPLTVFRVVDDLDEALRVTHGRRLSRCGEWKLAHLDVETRFFGLRFSVSNGRDLGLTVRTAGDILIVDRSHILAGDLFDAPNALVACLLRQPRSSRHIPDGINAVHVRSVELVDDDSPGLRLDTGLLEPYILDIAHDAHGGENLITFECFLALLRLHLHLQGLAARIDGLHLRCGKDFDALLLVGALELLGHVGVFDRHEAIQQLDDGHLGAHLMIEVGELPADRAGAADHEPLRRLLLEQSLAIRDDLLPVDGQRRDLAGTSTGGNDDMLRLDRLLLADGLAIHVGRGFDRYFALAGQAAMPEENV